MTTQTSASAAAAPATDPAVVAAAATTLAAGDDPALAGTTPDDKAAAEALAKKEADDAAAAQTTNDKAAADKKAADDAAEATRRAALTQEQREAEDKIAADKKAADDAAAAKAKGVPEKYELKLPEGVTLDAEITTAFEAKAKALGLTQKDAQELYDLGAQVTAKNMASMTAQVSQTQASWLAAAQADKEFGGESLVANMAVAKKALSFATPEFKTMLNESKLGNHPEIIRFMYRIGKAMSEDGYVASSAGSGNRDTSLEGRAARIYGDKKN